MKFGVCVHADSDTWWPGILKKNVALFLFCEIPLSLKCYGLGDLREWY